MGRNPAEYNQRLILQAPGTGKDEDGFPITQPVEYARVWASLKTLKGSTFYAAAQNNMENNREFVTRYQKKLDFNKIPKSVTILWKNQKHELAAPIENIDGMNVEMKIIVRAVT